MPDIDLYTLLTIVALGVVIYSARQLGLQQVQRAPRPAFATLPGGLRIGQAVAHAKFGQGVIVAAEGSGEDAKVQINFGPAGMKWLLLAVAKLDPA